MLFRSISSIVEGPKAGGHLGFTKESLEDESKKFDSTILDIIKETSIYEVKKVTSKKNK